MVQGQVCVILGPRRGPHTVQPGREVASCEGLTARLEIPWLSQVSLSAGVCPDVPNTMRLPLAATTVPTGGAPGAGRLQLLPGVCTAAWGVL